MKRRSHGQCQGAFGPCCFELLAGQSHGGLAAGDDGLAGVVEIGGLHHLAVASGKAALSLVANLHHFGRVQAQHGGHGARAHRHRFLHGLGTKPHQGHGVGQTEGSAGHQRGVLAQGMTRHKVRGRATLGLPHAVSRDGSHQHHRLGVGGECQLFFGAFMDQLAQVLAERLAGLLQEGFHHRVVVPRVQHAHRLRALARKYKCKCRHINSATK